MTSIPRPRRSRRLGATSASPPQIHFDNPGALDAFVHKPDGLAAGAAGAALVVVLHGCTQSGPAYARDAGWIELADREGFVVLAPGQARANNPNLCFNWYSRDHADADGREVRSILAMITATIQASDLDPRRVYVTGLSAGGAMAFALACHHPQVFAGVGIIAGLPSGCADSLPEALALMKGRHPPAGDRSSSTVTLAPGQAPVLSVWHGQADPIVVPSNADAIAAQWADLTGLTRQAGKTETSGKVSRSIWTHADGSLAMEVKRIAGFGHATPLATQGPEGLGRSAPHMVECGVSSTLELARSWGLARQTAAPRSSRSRDRGEAESRVLESPPTSVAADTAGLGERDAGPGLRSDIMATLQGRVPSSVQDLIDRSLRQAGL